MADNRTGLSAADIAEQFRDVCGDGSMEWVAGPMQTWLLLDAADMLDENDGLRKLVARMAEALGIDCEWADPNWCKSPCVLEFGCWANDEHAELRCPAWAAMRELGVVK